MQSPLWATAKRGRRIAARAYEVPHGPPMLLLLYQLGPAAASGYVPWGPIPDPAHRSGLYLEALSEALRGDLPSQTVFIRYDLPWGSPWAEDGEGRPSVGTRELEMNFGTEFHRLRKAPSNVQPADSLIVDVSKPADARLAAMKGKTRYNVRLGLRKGVRVRAASPDRLDEWYRIYRRTMERHGTAVHERRHFDSLFEAARRTPRAAAHPGSPPRRHNVRLLLAERAGTPLAGLILSVTDSYALYLYGASEDHGRGVMPAYVLQWEAMETARRLGANRYDLFGIPPDRRASHPMHGLLRFKEGFGGQRVVRRGTWDYPLDEQRYRDIAARQSVEIGYHR